VVVGRGGRGVLARVNKAKHRDPGKRHRDHVTLYVLQPGGSGVASLGIFKLKTSYTLFVSFSSLSSSSHLIKM
jgi:hypothetical protein